MKKKKVKSTPVRSRKSDTRRRTAGSFSSDEGGDVEVGRSGGVRRGGSDSEEEASGDGSGGEWSDSGGSESSEPLLEFTDGLDENLIGDTDDRARWVGGEVGEGDGMGKWVGRCVEHEGGAVGGK